LNETKIQALTLVIDSINEELRKCKFVAKIESYMSLTYNKGMNGYLKNVHAKEIEKGYYLLEQKSKKLKQLDHEKKKKNNRKC
jgi:hypothetical protein